MANANMGVRSIRAQIASAVDVLAQAATDILVHWALRREELCDPGLCPEAPEDDDQRCDHCPLDRLDAAQCAEKGLLIRRALDLMGALKLGVQIGLDEIRADEFCAMLNHR
jgi:hypothetical protein